MGKLLNLFPVWWKVAGVLGAITIVVALGALVRSNIADNAVREVLQEQERINVEIRDTTRAAIRQSVRPKPRPADIDAAVSDAREWLRSYQSDRERAD